MNERDNSYIESLETHIFSDSVILSVDPTRDEILGLMLRLSHLIWDSMRLGIWMRGGISIGDISVGKDRPWGIGIIEAYRTESTIANYPRVALAASATQAFQSKKLFSGEPYKFDRDEDGVWSLDIVSTYINMASLNEGQDIARSEALEILTQLNESERSLVASPREYEKIKWLCHKWNQKIYQLEYTSGPQLSNDIAPKYNSMGQREF